MQIDSAHVPADLWGIRTIDSSRGPCMEDDCLCLVFLGLSCGKQANTADAAMLAGDSTSVAMECGRKGLSSSSVLSFLNQVYPSNRMMVLHLLSTCCVFSVSLCVCIYVLGISWSKLKDPSCKMCCLP